MFERPLALFSALTVACAVVTPGCDDQEPITIDICGDIECEDGLFCDADTAQCVCDDGSCGHARVCDSDGTSCLEQPWEHCETGTELGDQGCQCDPDLCQDDGWACTDDGTGCVLADADARCVDGPGFWQGDGPTFSEISQRANLPQMGVEGIRLSTVDVTNSGHPDLLVRKGLAGADDFSDGGDRQFWLLENQGDATFEDITEESGLLQRRYDDEPNLGRPAEVIAFADIDNSGALDAVTLTSNFEDDGSVEGAEVLFNDGAGQFELGPVSEPLHATGEQISRSAIAFTDIDGDGFVDLWIGHGAVPGQLPGQDRLLLGDGTGSFVDVTDDRGLNTQSSSRPDVLNAADGNSNAWSVAACDLDGDGISELLAASYGRGPNHLWDADGGNDTIFFENHSVDSGYAFDHRTDWSDNESARCYCMHNRDVEDCADIPEPAYIRCDSAQDAFRWNHARDREPYRLGGNSGTTVCADLNNNSMLDLLTTEIVHWDVGESSDPSEILYNTGEKPVRFERPGNDETGLLKPRDGIVFDDGDITAAAFDFDNSGRLDILIASTDYPGTRAHLYHQRTDGQFEYVPIDLGIDLTSAHGIAIADFHRNGALDVAIGHSRSRCGSGDHCLEDAHVRLFENQVGAENNWIQLDLEGANGSNRAAIGARVQVATDETHRISEVDGGHGHYGMQHDLIQHFGLGTACEAKVTIYWPDEAGTTERYRLPAGHRYHVRQGERPTIID